MKKRFLLFVIIFIFYDESFSSAPTYKPYYEVPSYIDIDWVLPSYVDEVSYDSKTMFEKLLGQYNDLYNISREENDCTDSWKSISYIVYKNNVEQLVRNKRVEFEKLDELLGEVPSCYEKYNYAVKRQYPAAVNFLSAAFLDENLKKGHKELVELRHKILSINSSNNNIDNIIIEINRSKEQNADNKLLTYYLTYLEATSYFYGENYEKSMDTFKVLQNNLKNDQDPNWLRESVAYMIPRINLILSQKLWSGYGGDIGKIIKPLVEEADKGFNQYIKLYPKGLYVDSAQNIQRRILYLSGQDKKLRTSIVEQLSNVLDKNVKTDKDKKQIILLTTELYTYLQKQREYEGDNVVFKDLEIDMPSEISPLVIAYFLFDRQAFDFSEMENLLKNNSKKFSQYKGLYRFLRALILYKSKQYQKILDEINFEPIEDGAVTATSTEVLRARAFAALKHNDNAIVSWKSVYDARKDDQAALEIVGLYLQENNLKQLMYADSIMKKPKILEDLAHYGFTDDELEQILTSGKISEDVEGIVVQELCRRYLLSKQFSKMLELYNFKKYSGIYYAVKASVVTLAKNPHDAKSLLAIAEFIYHYGLAPNSRSDKGKNNFKYGSYDYYPMENTIIQRAALASKFSERIKKYTPPINYFLEVSSSFKNSNAKSELEAEALHYLVRCFSCYECMNDCEWDSKHENLSKAWFRRLHKKYPQSQFAENTPYYYSLEKFF